MRLQSGVEQFLVRDQLGQREIRQGLSPGLVCLLSRGFPALVQHVQGHTYEDTSSSQVMGDLLSVVPSLGGTSNPGAGHRSLAPMVVGRQRPPSQGYVCSDRPESHKFEGAGPANGLQTAPARPRNHPRSRRRSPRGPFRAAIAERRSTFRVAPLRAVTRSHSKTAGNSDSSDLRQSHPPPTLPSSLLLPPGNSCGGHGAQRYPLSRISIRRQCLLKDCGFGGVKLDPPCKSFMLKPIDPTLSFFSQNYLAIAECIQRVVQC